MVLLSIPSLVCNLGHLFPTLTPCFSFFSHSGKSSRRFQILSVSAVWPELKYRRNYECSSLPQNCPHSYFQHLETGCDGLPVPLSLSPYSPKPCVCCYYCWFWLLVSPIPAFSSCGNPTLHSITNIRATSSGKPSCSLLSPLLGLLCPLPFRSIFSQVSVIVGLATLLAACSEDRSAALYR